MTDTIIIRDEGTHISVVLHFLNDLGEPRTKELTNACGSPCFTRWQADKRAAALRQRGYEVIEEAGR